MIGFLNRLFGGGPLFDLDGETSKLLASLPPCSEHVIVASDRYSQKYRCEVQVPTSKLEPFVRHLTESTFGGSKESQVARKAMPRWLQAASLTDSKASYLPTAFVDILDAYVLNFIRDGIATVTCKECGCAITDIDEEAENRKVSGSWSEWTSRWHCPKGHLLYTEDHDVHIFRRIES